MKINSLKGSAFAATALAFASFGDAFLYPFLPVNHALVGVPVFWVGVLLSVNRFIRIFSNVWMVRFFVKFGMRTVLIFASMAAIVSTVGYSVASGVFAWLACRILWGLSFSAMRIGTLGYALGSGRPGLALGVSRSLQEAGPMIALLLAPFLLCQFQPREIFIVLALVSLPALCFAFALPKMEVNPVAIEKINFLKIPSTLNLMTLLSAILIDGIIVIVLGVLFLRYRNDVSLIQATSLAAFYLGYRRLCLVTLSSAGGWIADRIGLRTVFGISFLFVVAGLGMIVMGWVAAGAVVVFSFYSVNSAITPGAVATMHGNPLVAASENATWRDIGAATGTLAGALLINTMYLNQVLLILTVILFLLFIAYIGFIKKEINHPAYGSS